MYLFILSVSKRQTNLKKKYVDNWCIPSFLHLLENKSLAIY